MDERPKILIVDDEAFNVDYLEQELEDLDCVTATARNGREALAWVATEKVDLILLDIMMPEMDGFEVLSHLKADEALRDIPVVVISALDDVSHIARGIQMGAEDYLPKPFDPVLLKARIDACLEKKRLRDREVLYVRQLNRELDLAWQVQSGLLPAPLPVVPGWQIAASLKPSRQTSGDFYDLIPLSDGQLGVLIADVADKGMGAALLMVLSRTLIRTFAGQYGAQPELVLEAANQRLLSDIDTDQFVTVFYGVLDPASGVLAYCNAGHNPPYLLPAQDRGPVQALRRTGMPLGLFEDAGWERRSVEIGLGDTLLLYTDGLTDTQDEQGAFFGDERLLEVALAELGHSAQHLCDTLMAQAYAYMGGGPQVDDMTLAVIVREGGKVRA